MKKIILIFIGIFLTVEGFSQVSTTSDIKTNSIDQNQKLDAIMNNNQRSIFSLKEGKVYTEFRYCSGGSKLTFIGLQNIERFGPYTSLGYRIQNNYIGHDFSLNETYIYDKYRSYNDFGFDYSLLFYPIPNIYKEIYLGPVIGLSIFSFKWSSYVTIPIVNLGGVIGAQYKIKNKLHFIQIKTEIQGLSPDLWLLGTGVSYGISF